MRFLRSSTMVLFLAVAIGVIVSLSMGTAVKVEAEEGLLMAHLPMFVISTATVWLPMMIVRRVVLGEEDRFG